MQSTETSSGLRSGILPPQMPSNVRLSSVRLRDRSAILDL